MGEAKRRKILDPTYGSAKINKCFLEKSPLSDRHGVFVKIWHGRSSSILPVCFFEDLDTAALWLYRVELVANRYKFSGSLMEDVKSFQSFIQQIYGEFEDDRGQFINLINNDGSLSTLGEVGGKKSPSKKYTPATISGEFGIEAFFISPPPIANECDLIFISSYYSIGYICNYLNKNEMPILSDEVLSNLAKESDKKLDQIRVAAELDYLNLQNEEDFNKNKN